MRTRISITTIITVLSLLFTGLFWIYTMNGIPARVTVVETKVETLEKQLVKNDTKTDLILQAVYELRQCILGSK